MTGLETLIRKPRAIDLYSGVGGWSLDLRLAGIDVIDSYEPWGPANETNFKNNPHQAQTAALRRMSLAELPSDIDVAAGRDRKRKSLKSSNSYASRMPDYSTNKK